MVGLIKPIPKVFAIRFSDLKYWDVRSMRLSLGNICYWPTMPLGSICKVRKDIVSSKEIQSGKVELLDRISFDEGKVYFGNRTKTKMTQFRALPGDIVVSKINARKRAIGIVLENIEIGVTIHFRALIPDTSKADTRFLWAALRSQYCMNQFEIETGGIGKGEISEENLLKVKVPLPPLDVQRTIVKRWERAQQEIKEAEGKIEKLKTVIVRQFLTNLGLEIPESKPAPKYFAVNWQNVTRWSVSANQAIQSAADLSVGAHPVTPLGSILVRTQYGTSKKASTDEEGLPIIRMNNIVDGKLNLMDLKYIKLTNREERSLLLNDGDILFNRTNSKELVGKCAVFHATEEYVFASYIIRLEVDSEKALPDYVSHALNSAIGRRQIDALSRQIIGQANINSEEIRSLLVPLPPLETQRKIMKEVEEGRKEIENLKRKAVETKEKIDEKVEELILGIRKPEEKNDGSNKA